MPDLGEVVPNRAMLGATVVPESHRFLLPAEPAMELRRRDMVVEHLQDRIALVLVQPFYPGRKILIHEQCFTAAYRMCSNDWM